MCETFVKKYGNFIVFILIWFPYLRLKGSDVLVRLLYKYAWFLNGNCDQRVQRVSKLILSKFGYNYNYLNNLNSCSAE